MQRDSSKRGPGPIIATASSETASGAKKVARAALAMGANRVEIRLDLLASGEERQRAVALAAQMPLLVSGDRREVQPGEWPHFQRASELGAWVDMPAEGIPEQLLKEVDRSHLVLSWHGRAGEKAELATVLSRMKERRAAAYKIVPFAADESGNLQVRAFLLNSGARNDLIVFASGANGVASRILALAWGSRATYAYAPGCQAAGPGQPPLELLLSCAPLEITSSTPLIGLLGWPLEFSKTPGFFNDWLRKAGRPERYVIFPLKKILGFSRLAPRFNLAAAAITIPHKQAAMKEAAVLSRLARVTGAANTLIARPEGWMAANTDVYGVRRALRGFTTQRPRALVLGAGGAAAAAAMALSRRGPLAICARNPKNAELLATRFNCETVQWKERGKASWDLLVNATPLGREMAENPMPDGRLQGGAVMDMVVLPEGETALVQAARAQGLEVFLGEQMLRAQARLQFRLFTGKTPGE